MKNLTFIRNNLTNKLETEELIGSKLLYKAQIDESDFSAQIYEISEKYTRAVYYIESNTINDLKKKLKKQLKEFGVKFDRQMRKKID